MKKITGVLAFAALLFACSAIPAFAHTHLDTSDPEEDSTVTEPLDNVTLYFETVIEESAVMALQHEDGTEITLDNQAVNDDTFSADVTEPLKNGTYTLSWDIIGVDGHAMEDSISFEVDAEETAAEDEEGTDAAENTENASDEQADERESAQESDVQEEAADDTNSNTLLIAVLVIAIVAIIAIVLLRRKK